MMQDVMPTMNVPISLAAMASRVTAAGIQIIAQRAFACPTAKQKQIVVLELKFPVKHARSMSVAPSRDTVELRTISVRLILAAKAIAHSQARQDKVVPTSVIWSLGKLSSTKASMI